LEKSVDELKELRAGELSLVYFGIETGNDELLSKIDKGVNAAQMIEALHRAYEAGIKISATIILGIGGEEYTREHISETARLINAASITYPLYLTAGIARGSKGTLLKSI